MFKALNFCMKSTLTFVIQEQGNLLLYVYYGAVIKTSSGLMVWWYATLSHTKLDYA